MVLLQNDMVVVVHLMEGVVLVLEELLQEEDSMIKVLLHQYIRIIVDQDNVVDRLGDGGVGSRGKKRGRSQSQSPDRGNLRRHRY